MSTAANRSDGKLRGILYGVSLSPFVRKVRAVLALKSIEYELVQVMPGAMDPEFLAKSPLSQIPVWEEGDWALPDSSSICAYLERTDPNPAIYPEDPREFAKGLFWEEYADTRLVDLSNPIFFQRVVQEKVFKQSADEEIVRRCLDEVLPPVFDQIEEVYIPGADASKMTISTLSMWVPFVSLEHADVKVDAKNWPGLAAFLEMMSEHEVLRALVAEERAALIAY